MKILQVITSLHIGGAEKLIVDMVPLYQKKGYQVDVLLFDGTETPFKKQLQEKGVEIYKLGEDSCVYNPLFIFKLISFLKKYDIVHTHNTAPQLFVAIGGVFCSAILVTTEHNTSNRRRDWKWYRCIDRWMYSQYETIICISDKTEEALRGYLKKSFAQIETIYNGVDIQLQRDTSSCTVSRNNKCIVTMVAGFRYQKDQDTLIRSFTYLPKDKYELWLVGNGERRKILESVAEKLHIESQVKFLGIRSDIPQILKSSDIIVMSSHYEGFGIAAVEGMAAGKPVVASDVPGLGDIVKGAGLLFPCGDEKALAAIIQQLMENNDFYQETAKRCMQRAAEYDIQKTVDAYLNVYKKVLHES